MGDDKLSCLKFDERINPLSPSENVSLLQGIKHQNCRNDQLMITYFGARQNVWVWWKTFVVLKGKNGMVRRKESGQSALRAGGCDVGSRQEECSYETERRE